MAAAGTDPTLVVTGPTVVEFADTVGISAEISLDRPHPELPDPPASVVVRVHDLSTLGADGEALVAAAVEAGLTPLVPAVATAASYYGADVVFDGPVCATAVAGARRAIGLTARWFGSAPIELHAPGATGAPPAGRRPQRGLLFSRGLDSMATLCAMRHRGEPPTHLVGMDWVDDPYAGPPQAAIWQATASAAAEAGLPLVRVTTSARQLTDPVTTWGRAHVPVLAGAALALAGIVGSVGVSSTYGPAQRGAYPSHPDLDPLWSSAAVGIEHRHDVDGNRITKAAVVAADAWAARWLKVCWQRPGDGNCGRCRKCLVTMTALWLIGSGDLIDAVFDAPLDPDSVRACAASHPMGAPGNFEDAARTLREVAAGKPPPAPVVMGADPAQRAFASALADAWEFVIAAREAP